MKKFIIVVSAVICIILLFYYLYYYEGVYIDIHPSKMASAFMKTEGKRIYMKTDAAFEEFEIKGVNLGSGIPGKWSTDFSIDKETYIRWLDYIQQMGANTVRVYTIQSEAFYNAFYEYNRDRTDPLYLLHGVWINDYVHNSHRDAYDKDFFDPFMRDCKTMVDVIHGNRKIKSGGVNSAGSGTYGHDISQWVIGYILGVEWEDVTVVYTDEKYKNDEKYSSYTGEYMYTTEDASPFEALLARVGDEIIEYESKRYKQQRLIAFANWPTTDPFEYPDDVTKHFMKCAMIDVEHIASTDQFISGHFASYHVYPYFPDYLNYVDDWTQYGIDDISKHYVDGVLNTYSAYLNALTMHHTIPTVISEFGVSAGRGMAQKDQNTGRNQGNMSETDQGIALVDCYNDIISAGCAGSCIFTWQDEWFKRTWNTMYSVDLKRTAYWSDYQTNEQYFGLLSFDPGAESSVCYVDGDISEWKDDDKVSSNNGMSLSMKYDEKFIYFRVNKAGLDYSNEKIYIPIDITQKSGSSYCMNYQLYFDRAVDFLIIIDGKDNSRVQVQERYESLRSTYSIDVLGLNAYVKENIPDVDSPLFVNIDMILQIPTPLLNKGNSAKAEVYETGKLTYGNANPKSEDFNSLADFIINGEDIEIKIPWQLLNFADPSRCMVHDDYYDGNYGVKHIAIDSIYAGVGTNAKTNPIALEQFSLEGWRNRVTYHERLKSSYYIVQELWTKDNESR